MAFTREFNPAATAAVSTTSGAARTVYAHNPPEGLTAIRADGSDEAAALRALLTYVKSQWGTGRVILPDGWSVRCDTAIILPTKVQLAAPTRATLNFAGLSTTGTAVTIADSDWIPLAHIRITGPGKTSSALGVSVQGSGMGFEELDVRQFGTGVDVGNENTYTTKFLGGAIGDCTLGLDADVTGTNNSGERMVFEDFTFFNSTRAIKTNSGGGCTIFNDCSFDYCTTTALMSEGYTYFNSCHFESNDTVTTTSYMIALSGNPRSTFTNCTIIMGGTGNLKQLLDPATAPFNYGNGMIRFDGTSAFIAGAGGDGGRRSSEELVTIAPGATTATVKSPFVHRWGPISIEPAWMDGRVPQAGITPALTIDVAAGTFTITLSGAPATSQSYLVSF